ncbi:MAG: hypothetical protein ACREQN_08625, partial [Candidatus Binataceae bacterium]
MEQNSATTMTAETTPEGCQSISGTARGAHHRLALDRCGLGALALYGALSILFFGRSVITHLGRNYVGMSPDPSLFMWFLVWWPHALVHQLNPFMTQAIWAPQGFNLAWSTCVPLASWVASPLTALFGPVASYNVLILLAPALTAWIAFMLCRYVTGSLW